MNPVKGAALNIFINMIKTGLIGVLLLTVGFHLLLISTLHLLLHLFTEKEVSFLRINYIAIVFTLFYLSYGLLIVFNSEQFSMFATFISLPFLTFLPKLGSEFLQYFDSLKSLMEKWRKRN